MIRQIYAALKSRFYRSEAQTDDELLIDCGMPTSESGLLKVVNAVYTSTHSEEIKSAHHEQPRHPTRVLSAQKGLRRTIELNKTGCLVIIEPEYKMGESK